MSLLAEPLTVIEGLDEFLSDRQPPGIPELRQGLREVLGWHEGLGHLIRQEPLRADVYRLYFALDDQTYSLIVKRLRPDLAQRNQWVAQHWLPAVGLGESGPPLLNSVAERHGESVWQIYTDLGEGVLAENDPPLEQVKVVMELIACLHARFAGHAWLGECRVYGGDLGVHFFVVSVRDALNSLERLRPPRLDLSAERLALCQRLLQKIHCLHDQQSQRVELMQKWGGPETLLHGNLKPRKARIISTADELRARLIGWEQAAVGLVVYDLATFLSHLPLQQRLWTLGLYHQAPETPRWPMPSLAQLNLLFDTAARARLANRLIWPAIAAWESQADWAFDQLAQIDHELTILKPLLPP